MLTTGEAITIGLRDGHQASPETVAHDERLRAQAHLALVQIVARSYVLAPHWWKHGDGTVTVLANQPSGACPVDFSNFGTYTQVWLSGLTYALDWMDPGELEARRQTSPGQRQNPTHYTLKSQSLLGIRQLDVWPTPGANVTLLLKNYVKGLPELIDVPVAPGVAVNEAAGNLTGPLSYRVTFIHALGETEGGFVSESIKPDTQKADITPIPVSTSRLVTGRGLYRTAASGIQHKLAATINDNITTEVLAENVADGSLGVAVPTPSVAVTGMELLPADFHELVYVDGLVKMLRAQLKQAPFNLFSEDWQKDVKRLWADQRQDRHIPRAMPPYGGYAISRRRPRLLS